MRDGSNVPQKVSLSHVATDSAAPSFAASVGWRRRAVGGSLWAAGGRGGCGALAIGGKRATQRTLGKQLSDLQTAFEAGILTDEEFAEKRSQIMAQSQIDE